MRFYVRKLTILAFVGLMITGPAQKAEALIPLPTFDVTRIGQSVATSIQQVLGNAAQVAANIQHYKEIAHMGFGGAAKMLFREFEMGNIAGLVGSSLGLSQTLKFNSANKKLLAEMEVECKKRAEEAYQKVKATENDQCKGQEGDDLKKCTDSVLGAADAQKTQANNECVHEYNAKLAKIYADFKKREMKILQWTDARNIYVQRSGNAAADRINDVYQWAKGAGISNVIGAAETGDWRTILGSAAQPINSAGQVYDANTVANAIQNQQNNANASQNSGGNSGSGTTGGSAGGDAAGGSTGGDAAGGSAGNNDSGGSSNAGGNGWNNPLAGSNSQQTGGENQ